eukprot:m.126348 g.126348  ORF g.126348 m.126348 type:complete len:247 (-) comp52233_c0_seq8:56-796(-)
MSFSPLTHVGCKYVQCHSAAGVQFDRGARGQGGFWRRSGGPPEAKLERTQHDPLSASPTAPKVCRLDFLLARTLLTLSGCSPHEPLCGCVPMRDAHQFESGELVAAHVVKHPDDKWILAVVVASEKDKVTVEDVLEEDNQREVHSLVKRNIVALPRWRPPPGVPGTFFPGEMQVLGVYPQTTCFYRAAVFQPPTETRNSYLLRFEDDGFEDGQVRHQEVPIRFVIADMSTLAGATSSKPKKEKSLK